jgi:hypothetical protein
MRFYEILLEDYKTTAKKYVASGFDANLVTTILSKFRQIQPRISDINLKNIDWWATNRTFKQLEEYVNNFEGIPTKSQMGKKTGRSHNIVENDQWLIVVPLDKDASCFHGKTTDWCTTKPFKSHYEDYFYNNNITLIYCIQKKTGSKWAIAAHNKHLHNTEYFDVNDTPLDKDEFEKQTKLNVDEILSIAFGEDVQSNVEQSRTDYVTAIKRIDELLRVVEKTHTQNQEIESLLWFTKDSSRLRAYMQNVGPASYNKNLELFAANTVDNAITMIKNPSEKIQLISADNDGWTTLTYLFKTYGEDNVSDAVKLACIKNFASIISIVTKQSEEMKRMAVESGLTRLNYLKKPISDELKLIALAKDGRAIRYIDNPTEEMQLVAVKKYGSTLDEILRKNIKPSESVLLASVMHGDADDAIEQMIKYKIKISDEVLKTSLSWSDDVKKILGFVAMEDIELSMGAQIEAVKNDPFTIYSLFSLYDGKVNEVVQIIAAKENGSAYINETMRFMNTTRKLANMSSTAIEEAIKSTPHLAEKMLKSLNIFKKNTPEFDAYPTYTAFKNAVDGFVEKEYNGSVIAALELSFQYPEINEKLTQYALSKAKETNNKMLLTLVNEYISKSDSDNLTFEPDPLFKY